MVKYVDAGVADAAADKGKKKARKGFKADRLENYKRMLSKKHGKKVTATPTRTVRPKALVFDDAARRDYLLTLHKKKNERRVQAFVDAKRKHRKESARTRRDQREEARRAYNNFARVPILPDYTFRLPERRDDGFADEVADEVSEADHDDEGDDEGDDDGLPWMSVDNADAAAQEALERRDEKASPHQRRRAKRLATVRSSSHAMPGAMLGHETGDTAAATCSGASVDAVDGDYATVEVKPLFGGAGRDTGAASSQPLPSNNFDDLPLVVQQELRRLRQDTKGPAKTKPRMHMMKELDKIRKIHKHSRKGHGKRKTSGKRKNRKK
ncbi:hypothetical protein NESM_000602700 [Novymonas esmeraldas]|uniref:Nucleolar protein 12 n=1 Tax=Novymonas esmeraldas TaxID=1808958 RepID=A0AAW0ET98_9TRYP